MRIMYRAVVFGLLSAVSAWMAFAVVGQPLHAAVAVFSMTLMSILVPAFLSFAIYFAALAINDRKVTFAQLRETHSRAATAATLIVLSGWGCVVIGSFVLSAALSGLMLMTIGLHLTALGALKHLKVIKI